jgi:hypothetical protein
MPQPRISSQSSPSPIFISPAGAIAVDVDLHRRLGEGEVRGAEAHLHLVDLEERLAEFLQHPFQVSQMGALVDDEALDLVEHRRVGLVVVAAEDAARRDDADRRLLSTMVRICTGLVWVRSSIREPSAASGK